MGENTLEEYEQLVEEQARALLSVTQSVALGNLDVEVQVPEGIQALSELAVGLEMMIDHLRAARAEQEREKDALLKAHDETQRGLEEQVALRTAGAIITSALDQSTVLGRLAEQLCQAVIQKSRQAPSWPSITAQKLVQEIAYLIWASHMMSNRGAILSLPVNLTNIMWTIQT